jgi:hypothetical protein
MIKNNKGAILVITIVSMMILTIIGYITLQMVSSQNVMDTYDQVKVRTDYAAEGIVERALGYIAYVVIRSTVVTPVGDIYGDVGNNPTASGYLYSKVRSCAVDPDSGEHRWNLFNDAPTAGDLGAQDYGEIAPNAQFDDMFPNVSASVYCELVNGSENGFNLGIGENDVHIYNSAEASPMQTFKVVGTARAMVDAADGSEIVSTAICYFNMRRETSAPNADGNREIKYKRYIIGWRKS